MKLLFSIFCISALATSLSAEEAEPLPLASQTMIQQVLKSLGDNLAQYDSDPKTLSEAVANTIERANQIVEASKAENQAKTHALIASVEKTCLGAKQPSDLDDLFKKVTEQSLDSSIPFGGMDRGELNATVMIISNWQDFLSYRASSDGQAAVRSIDQILRALSQSPCIPRSKVIELKKEVEIEIAEKRRTGETREQKSAFARMAQDRAQQQREQEERDRKNNPRLPDPEWPDTLKSIPEILPLLDRLQSNIRDFDTKHPSRSAGSYGLIIKRLGALQRAAAESKSSRYAQVISILGKSMRPLDTGYSYPNNNSNMFPPPVTLMDSLSDFEYGLLRSSFQSLFGDVAEVAPEGSESPRSYVGKLAEALAEKNRYGDILELLPLISISNVYEQGADSNWIRADTEGITAFRQATAFLNADDIRNAVPAFRKVIESGGRHAPTKESAKILAELKVKFPEEMKRIR